MRVVNMKLNDGYSVFILRPRSCNDKKYSAKRADVAEAIRKARKPNAPHDTTTLRIRTSLPGFVPSLRISIDWTNGRLRLGCHRFTRPQTAIIVKWAGIKEKS